MTNTYLIDFHTHVMTPGGLSRLCPAEQGSAFFRYAVPLLEKLSHLSEPLHNSLLRHAAMHYRDPVSRFVYACCGQLGLMEALRLFKKYDLARLLRTMDRDGIGHAVIASIEPLTLTQEILDLTGHVSERVSVFASFNKDTEDAPAYIENLLRSGRVAGIKLHPIVGGWTCGELYEATREVVALATDKELPVLIHTGHIPVEALQGIGGCSEVPALEPLVSAFPKARFVLAHIGWESWRAVLRLAARYPNILVETSWQPARVIRRAVDALGAARVLFGSDYPLFGQPHALRQARNALSPREFVQVASSNARGLLRLTPAHGHWQRKSSAS